MSAVHVPAPVAPMIPRTLFNADHEAFRATARRFFETEIAPFHEKWEEQQHIDRHQHEIGPQPPPFERGRRHHDCRRGDLRAVMRDFRWSVHSDRLPRLGANIMRPLSKTP